MFAVRNKTKHPANVYSWGFPKKTQTWDLKAPKYSGIGRRMQKIKRPFLSCPLRRISSSSLFCTAGAGGNWAP